MASQLEEIPRKITDLEQQYKEIDANLTETRKKVQTYETSLLTCLQQLMPLQNAYLSNVINSLQKQLQLKSAELESATKKLSDSENLMASLHIDNVEADVDEDEED